ncbi:MAG: DNA-binding LacI/PurR family transcriptional regulator/biotin operon repressor [Rubritalea sp.]|jgi:DNA-binding LacI/PurR family transcriptional regulator/biotin operon repressor
MIPLHIASASEQAANYLREQLVRKVWVGTIPGGPVLASQLGVGRMTIEAALSMLENEGLLVPQGPGRRRKIVLPEDLVKPPGFRVAILVYEEGSKSLDYHVDCKNKLEAAGHTVFYAPSHLTEFKMDVRRLARMVGKIEADAWVVSAGTSEVLQWFLQQKIPAFAIFGRRRKLKIAGVGLDKIPALVEATQRLIELGHQRIVFLDSLYKFSEPGVTGTAFLDALSAGGITVGSYNLPGWEGGLEGLYAFLDSSFQHTPPTAIFAGSASTYFATLHFLLSKDIQVPRDLSLICVDDDPYFKQCRPSVSHIRWSNRSVANRIVNWVNNISEGKEDTRQTTIKAEFVEGGTIGQVPEG